MILYFRLTSYFYLLIHYLVFISFDLQVHLLKSLNGILPYKIRRVFRLTYKIIAVIIIRA